MRLTEQITFNGLDLSVTGDFQKAYASRDYDTPGEPDKFDIQHIEWNGMDVFDLFDKMDLLDEIEQEVLKKQ